MHHDEDKRYPCVMCGDNIGLGRWNLGYKVCKFCGEAEAQAEKRRKASMVQIPYSKGAYQYIHNPADLFHTNPKRTT